jgi:hypothetical protein
VGKFQPVSPHLFLLQEDKSHHSTQDHIWMGPSYRVNVITASAFQNSKYAASATDDFINKQAGILTSPGADLLGINLSSLFQKGLSAKLFQLGRNCHQPAAMFYQILLLPLSPLSLLIGLKLSILAQLPIWVTASHSHSQQMASTMALLVLSLLRLSPAVL